MTKSWWYIWCGEGEFGIKDDSLWVFDINVEWRPFAKGKKARGGLNLVGVRIKILILDMFEMHVRYLSLLFKEVFRYTFMEFKEEVWNRGLYLGIIGIYVLEVLRHICDWSDGKYRGRIYIKLKVPRPETCSRKDDTWRQKITNEN